MGDKRRKKKTNQQIQEILSKKRGMYVAETGRLKKGYKTIAAALGVTTADVKLAVANLRKKSQQEICGKNSEVPYTDLQLSKSIPQFQQVQQKVILDKPGLYFVTGCAHVPWHNRKMYRAFFRYLSTVDVAGVILAGDILDMNSVSSHDRGHIPLEGVTLNYEYEEGNKFLNQLERAVGPDAEKVYLYGNHEDRYNRLSRNVDYHKYGKALISPIDGLNLFKRGYKVIDNWKLGVVELGKDLDINHGEFINIHTAKKTIDVYKKSTMFVHTHRTQTFTDGDITGYNIGAGADFSAPIFSYATRAMKNSWSNASALVTVDNSGNTYVEVIRFVNNKICIGGQLY